MYAYAKKIAQQWDYTWNKMQMWFLYFAFKLPILPLWKCYLNYLN